MSALSIQSLMDIISQQRFGVEYQPIIATHSGEVFAFEALARFKNATGEAIGPLPVFRALHDSPITLFEVETALKHLQIENAPADHTLFVNVDQDAFAVMGSDENNPLIASFQNRDDLVVEIIENSNLADARISHQMAETFGKYNIRSALDDIGADESLLSLELLTEVDFLKLAMDWLPRRDNPKYRPLLECLIHYAHQSGKQVILEGVETEADLAFAKQIGVDFVQGFLYRPIFRSV